MIILNDEMINMETDERFLHPLSDEEIKEIDEWVNIKLIYKIISTYHTDDERDSKDLDFEG